MLTECFTVTERIHALRQEPVGAYVDGWADDLLTRGYARYYVHQLAALSEHLGAYLRAHQLAVDDLDEEIGQRFLQEMHAGQRRYRLLPLMLRHLLHYLREREVIAPAPPTPHVASPWDEVLTRYDHYLAEIHGLQPPTRLAYCRHAKQFLLWYQHHHGSGNLAELSAREVLAYVTVARNEQAPRGHAKLIATVLRSVLRFLWWEQVIPHALDAVVPTLRCWRLATVPKHLPWEQVRALIAGIDPSTPIGKRDRAIVLLLAVLGLRNSDVRLLELTHIAWREGELRLPRTKAGRARRLPLPQEVGEALASYLTEGRPAVQSPYVFVSHTPPFTAPLVASSLSSIIRRHLRRLQIEAPQWGTHLLRHSLATRLVNTRVSIKEVADLLGHASIDTTAIYTKVDRERLAAIALPFPGGVR